MLKSHCPDYSFTSLCLNVLIAACKRAASTETHTAFPHLTIPGKSQLFQMPQPLTMAVVGLLCMGLEQGKEM